MRVVLIIVMIKIPFFGISQINNDSIAKNKPSTYFFTENKSVIHVPDTTLDQFHFYFPETKTIFPFALNGNQGQAINSLIFDFGYSSGFIFKRDYFSNYFSSKDNFPFFYSTKPFTDVFYVNGSKKENYFSAIHTQNINKNFNAGFSYKKIKSEGFYRRQESNVTSFNFFTHYLSPKKNYESFFHAYLNNVSNQENGGITSDSILQDFPFMDKLLLPINLSDATTKKRAKGVFFKQVINPFKPSSSDSSLIFELGHLFKLEQEKWMFQDNQINSSFFENIYRDSSKTLDSTNYHKFQNEIFIRISLPLGRYKLDNQLSYLQENGKVFQLSKNKFENKAGTGKLILSKDKMRISLSGNYFFVGFNHNDFMISSVFEQRLGKNFEWRIVAGANYFRKEAEFLTSTFSSNNFIWNNSFSKTTVTNGFINISQSNTKINCSAEILRITNYIYFDSTSTPQQFTPSFDYFKIKLDKRFNLSSHFKLISNLLLQETSGPDLLRLPQLATVQTFFYENQIRKKSFYFNFQIGFDIIYTSSFIAKAYQPALGVYYLQDVKTVGNYPQTNLFLNFKIKNRARIFLKAENLTAGFIEPYSLVANYLMPGRSLKFGINWRFFD